MTSLLIQREQMKQSIDPKAPDDQTMLLPDRIIYLDDRPFATTNNQKLYRDIATPDFMGSFMSFHKLGLTIWGPFERKPVFNHYEKMICMI